MNSVPGSVALALVVFAGLAAAEGDSSARLALARAASAYAALTSYSDVMEREESIETDKTSRIVSLDRFTVVCQRPGSLAVTPESSGSLGRVLADGKRIFVEAPRLGHHATLPQGDQLWEELASIDLAAAVWSSLPVLFFFHSDPLASVDVLFGEIGGQLERVGDENRIALDVDGVTITIVLDATTGLLRALELVQPLEAGGRARAHRRTSVRDRNVLVDRPIGAAELAQTPREGSREMPYGELESLILAATTRVGKPCPEFVAAACVPGAEGLSPGRLLGKAAVVVFLEVLVTEGRAYLDELVAAAKAQAEVRIVPVAVDLDPDAAAAVLAATGVEGFLDPGGTVALSLGFEALPTGLRLDPDGVVSHEIRGAHDRATLLEVAKGGKQ